MANTTKNEVSGMKSVAEKSGMNTKTVKEIDTETLTSKGNNRYSAFLKEIRDNVSEGAKTLASMSSDVFEDVKEKAEDFYEKGSDKFDQASGVVQSYVDRFKGEREIEEMSKEKSELNSILGETVFHEFKKNGSVSRRFLTTKKTEMLFKSIEAIDKKILKIGRQIEKSQEQK